MSIPFYAACDHVLRTVRYKNTFQPHLLVRQANLPDELFREVLYKLMQDGYVRELTQGSNIYAITGEGIDFTTTGGYAAYNSKRSQDELKEAELRESTLQLQNLQVKDYKLTRILAWVGAIAGLLALLIEIFK
jgi:predicted transcriptional regulator